MNEALYNAVLKYRQGQELTQEDMDACLVGMMDAVEAVRAAWEGLNDLLKKTIPPLAEWLGDILKTLIAIYAELDRCPDRRVAHLARHAGKNRTRKKNIRRAFKILNAEYPKPPSIREGGNR